MQLIHYILGEDDLISLCAMCSDKHAAVRWNLSDSVTPKTLMVKYTCEYPHNPSTQVSEMISHVKSSLKHASQGE